MILDELITEVDSYFNTHLDSSFWKALPVESRQAAVSMALDDVLSELPGATLRKMCSGSYTFKAVAEQAVFLARNYESMTEGKVVTSESVEGLSTGYTLISDKFGIGNRAASFINRAKTLTNGGFMRIVRG
jgi:hypothetical protein